MSFLAYTDDGRTVPSALGPRLLRRDETAVMIPPPDRDPKLVAFETGDHGSEVDTLVGVAGQEVRQKIDGLEEYGPDTDTPMRFVAVFADHSWIEAVAPSEWDKYIVLDSGLTFDDTTIYRCFRAESLPAGLVAHLRKQVEERDQREMPESTVNIEPCFLGMDPAAPGGDMTVTGRNYAGPAAFAEQQPQRDQRLLKLPSGKWALLERTDPGACPFVAAVYSEGPCPMSNVLEITDRAFTTAELLVFGRGADTICARGELRYNPRAGMSASLTADEVAMKMQAANQRLPSLIELIKGPRVI